MKASTDKAEKRANILIVDDQPKNLLALEAVLEPLGQNLVKAHSGREALKHLLAEEFAVILLDVQMPEMDGFETAALIKQRPRSRHIPILFLTANNRDSDFVFKGYNAGAVDYILKPIEPDVLRSKVSVFIDIFNKGESIKHQADARREREVAEFRKQSERRYRDLADSVPHMVWTADAHGHLTYCNRRWFELSGEEPKEELEFGSVLHVDDQARFLEEWIAAVRSARDWEGEFRFGSEQTGGFRWHLVRALVVRDSGEGSISWVGTGTDIDDRKQAAAAVRVLAEASADLAGSLDYEAALAKVAALTLPALGDVCVVDLMGEDQCIRRVALAVLLGDEALSASVRNVGLDRLGSATVIRTGQRQIVWDAASLGSDAELFAVLRDLRAQSYVCVPIKLRERAVGAMTFITTRGHQRFGAAELTIAEDLARRAAAAIDNATLYAIVQREKARLEEVNRAKDEFLATLSHELRTPLNAILGWTQILRSRRVDESRMQHALETIERNAKSQAQLIADLLDVSRIIAGKLTLETSRVSLGGLIEECLEAARPAAEAKRIAFNIHVDAAVGDVSGDRVRLQQVTMNLVSNALKFTPAGGRITMSVTRAEDGCARVSVVDSGEGIAADFLPYVFDRFRQADSSMARKHGGLGLGLSIVKHLVEVHGGTVKVESPGKGQGATFSFSLPVLGEAQAGAGLSPVAGDAALLHLNADGLRGVRIVLVEDDPDGRDLLHTLLESYGAKVCAYATADAVIEHLATAGADVLISDIGLPNEDGYGLIRRVRSLAGETAAIPAIALTAYASKDDRGRALAAGFQAHVAKPIQPAELVRVVARLLEKEGRRQKELGWQRAARPLPH